MTDLFLHFSETAQQIMQARGTNAKIRICADYFTQLDNAHHVGLAAQFFGEGAFSTASGKRASVGHRTIAALAAEFCEIDYERVFRPCRTATGSSSETIEKLFRNLPAAVSKMQPEQFSLDDVDKITEQLYLSSKREQKQSILLDTWKGMTPLEVKYFIRILGQGSLRIGFESKSVVSAISKAFDHDPEEVRFVHMLSGSLAETASMAKINQLDDARFQLFSPVAFMLASPIESRSVENIQAYIAEEKFDGMRCQAHIDGQKVALFSRDLNDISSSFPEVVEFLTKKNIPATVFDGEICVFKDDTILPFQLLQKRMGVKKPSNKLLTEYPVLFIAYDILYFDGDTLFEKTLTERRKLLEEVCESFQIPITTQKSLRDSDEVEQLFDLALKHGNEGLMLKHRDSLYEYGQRRKSWLKVKQPSGSIDTVILYAHAGSGKRGGTYSDFTLGISVKDDERYEEEFIPIGKAYGGYSNEELAEINKRIKNLTLEKFGPTLLLKPEIVVELEFDDIQVNKRTKAKYTLRLPRFKAIRWDLSPSDADDLKHVEKLYQQKLDQQRLKQMNNPSFVI